MRDTQETLNELKREDERVQALLQRVELNEQTAQGIEDLQRGAEKIQEKIRGLQKEKELKAPVSDYLGDFIGDISERAKTPPISTGFKELDRVLGGGLHEGLTVLGAVTSAGKSALIMQIADQIAQSGHDVIVVALEMSRFELMARSISRHTYIRARGQGGRIAWAKTARGITDGNRHEQYNEQEKSLITDAITDYSKYTDHLRILEGVGDIGVKQIRKVVEKLQGDGTVERPVLIIDYLQILAPADVRATDKQNTDKSVIELKRLSRDLKLSVIAISSLNRESYKVKSEHRGAVTLDSFKESGAIEFSSDVLLGWQFQGAGGELDFEKEYQKNPREMQIVVLKNRQGERGCKINYNYLPMFNYCEETGTEQYRKNTAI